MTDLTIKQAAARKGVSEKTIRRAIDTGDLRAYRIGKRLIRIRPHDLERLGDEIPTSDTENQEEAR